MKNKFGKYHHSSIKIAKCDENGNVLCEFYGANEASRIDGESIGSIYWSIKHKTKTKNGFYWKRI